MESGSESPLGPSCTAQHATTSHHSTQAKRISQIKTKYKYERDKRLRPDGLRQYLDLIYGPASIEPGDREALGNPQLLDKIHHRALIVGAGFGGLLFAVRLIQSGFCTAEEIIFIDEAGGFGGTWHWNNYPGLECDIESYIYMPLLDDTAYMPTQKYVSGVELKDHADRIARQFNLTDRALFNTHVKTLTWNDRLFHWEAQILPGFGIPTMLEADIVILATGLLNSPKVPILRGAQTFEGHVFHSSRWDWNYTGGTPDSPDLVNLIDKRVAVVGTGASAVQVIPELANWAEKVLVFQRTPSSVDRRDNCVTPFSMGLEANQPGWQRLRMENFNAFVSNEYPLPQVNMVNDAWTRMPSWSALGGGPGNLHSTFFHQVLDQDYLRQMRLHHRIDSSVQDPATAEALKPWYPGWCKRPCFSDTYLQAFNQDNVVLIDTDGMGIRSLTQNGILLDDIEYEVDAIVLCTGYRYGSSVDCGKLVVTGRGGGTLKGKSTTGIKTLHGVISRDFPNLFFPGPSQAGATANQMYVLDQLSIHVGYILSTVSKLVSSSQPSGKSLRFSIEPTVEGETQWTEQVLTRAYGVSGVADCTPSYFNREGLYAKEAVRLTVSQASHWGEGIKDYVDRIERWRARAMLEGFEINTCDIQDSEEMFTMDL
ncbi:hypothetical protein N7462_000966 [Penicillium macrosclerotiorum]|uniref:uncharacterized protein n=1 Tax=Penicillium macrosclerotiorum TaxID=303699 RepID=UPI00254860AD|nr:uncharacterized protein N7462_000966 [Penicillium macrosclerotiorum]KAJ5698961.1 hypothetical protein N7462_000966 [Penicillium macrosclerotiorum]